MDTMKDNARQYINAGRVVKKILGRHFYDDDLETALKEYHERKYSSVTETTEAVAQARKEQVRIAFSILRDVASEHGIDIPKGLSLRQALTLAMTEAIKHGLEDDSDTEEEDSEEDNSSEESTSGDDVDELFENLFGEGKLHSPTTSCRKRYSRFLILRCLRRQRRLK